MTHDTVWTPEICGTLTTTLEGYGLVPTREVSSGGKGSYSILVSESRNLPRFGSRQGDMIRTWILTFQPAAVEDFGLAIAEELHRWGILQIETMNQETGE
jgi:hypothetical protein